MLVTITYGKEPKRNVSVIIVGFGAQVLGGRGV